jgi:hypothetical protein
MKSPESFRPKNSESKPENGSQEISAAEFLKYNNWIQIELMKRSQLEDMAWVQKYSQKFRDLFKENKEEFIKMYHEDLEALCALIAVVLEKDNGDNKKSQ